MRRPNRSGSVYKLGGKRHKPWAVKMTVGYDDEGRQIRKYVGYYETRREAIEALEKLNSDPFDTAAMTVAEAWQGWTESFQGSENTIAGYRSAFNRAKPIHQCKLEDLNLSMMQAVVDTEPKTYSTAAAAKKMLSAILEYGFAHDACPASRKDLLKYIVMPERPSKEGSARRFTDDEIQEAIDSDCILAVVLLFTGLRRQELLDLTMEDIDLDAQTINVRKSKTAAGVRIVPIPDKLIPWIKRYIEAGSIGKSRFYIENNMWKPYPLHGHRRHDCRHTYISILTEAGVDERMIKALVGHAGGVTTDVYTHYTNAVLLEAVNAAFAKYLLDLSQPDPYAEWLSA